MKNKTMKILIMVLVMIMSTQTMVFASNGLPFEISEMKIGLVKDGEIITWDEEEYGRLFTTDAGRSMIPIRIIAEKLNFTVTWDGSTQTVGLSKGDKSINFPIGAYEIQTDKGLLVMEVPATVIDGRTHAPVRFASEALGVKVEWKSHKHIEGSQNYPYDFYVVLTTGEEADSTTASVGKNEWYTVHSDDAVVDFLEKASDKTKVYNGAGSIKIGSDSRINDGNLNIMTGMDDTVQFQIIGWSQPMVKESIEEFLKLWWNADSTEIWNDVLKVETGYPDAWEKFVTASNGTTYKLTDEGEGVRIIIKK